MTAGWMPGVEIIKTDAFTPGRGGQQIKAVASHIMQGYQTTMLAWAKERPAATMKSAHFTIGRGGRIVQHVSINDTAWTNGYVGNPTWAPAMAGVNPNKLTVTIEHEGFSIPPGYGFDYVYTEGRPWPAAMVDASLRVHRWVFEQTSLKPNADSVIGHYHIDSVNRPECPGKYWRDHVRPWLLEKLVVPTPAPMPTLALPSGPLTKEDVPALGQLAYGYRLNGADYAELPRQSDGRRVYKVVLP